MSLVIINYDLNSPGQDYSDLREAIKSLGPWKKPQKSTWFVVTNSSLMSIKTTLEKHLDSNDTIYVTKVMKDASGVMPDGFWDWYDKHAT